MLCQQPDKLLAILTDRIRPEQRAFAQKVFLLRHNPVHAKIDRRHRTVGVLTNNDETFFSP